MQTQKNNNTCFEAYFYSVGSQHRNLHQLSVMMNCVPILFCGPTQELELVIASTGKTQEWFGKNAGEWTSRVEISQEEIPGSRQSKHGYTDLLQARENLWVLNRWVYNFCIHNTQL